LASPTATLTASIEHRYRHWRMRIFAITWLAYASFYLVRKSFAVAKVAFADDPNVQLTKPQMGQIDSVYLILYSLGQFIWGPLGDRLGARRVVVTGMSIAVVAAVGTGLITAFWAFMALAALQGIGQSSGWSALVKNMSSWFSRDERGRIMGWWCTNYAIGGLVAGIFAAEMIDLFGHWQFGFFIPALTLGLVLILFLLFQRNRPEDIGLPPIEVLHGQRQYVVASPGGPNQPAEGSWKAMAEVLLKPTVWALAVSYFSLKLTRYALLFWGPMYVKEMLGTGVAESAWTSAAFELGGPLGVIAAGYASDRLFAARRIPVAVISLSILAGVLLLADQAVAMGQLGMAAFFFAAGFFLFGPDSLIVGAAAMDFGTKKGAGTAAGWINGVGSVGSILGGLLPGYVSTSEDWSTIFALFAAAVVVTALVLLPFWKTTPGR